MAERRDDHERHVLPIGSENVRRRLISCVRTNITLCIYPKKSILSKKSFILVKFNHLSSLCHKPEVCMCENGFLANI